MTIEHINSAMTELCALPQGDKARFADFLHGYFQNAERLPDEAEWHFAVSSYVKAVLLLSAQDDLSRTVPLDNPLVKDEGR